MYDNFSYYYDKMMDMNYDIFLNIVKKYIKNEGIILDAGCGTCELSILLYENGYKVYGADLSADMLNIARAKINKLGYNINLYENDLSIPFGINQFNAIISFFDVMNYIIDYKKAFKNIYDSLVSGGMFLFDVHQIDYINDLIGYEEKDEIDDFSYDWKVLKGDSENSIIHDLTIYANNKTYHEMHYQKTYSINTYIKDLTDIGFKVKILDETDEYKVFILAIKD